MNKINEAVYNGNLGFMEFHKFQRTAAPEEKIIFKELLKNKDYVGIKELLNKVLNVNMDDSFYKGKRTVESIEGRYIVKPLGLSYDSLEHVAVVATKKENGGNIVEDKETGQIFSRRDLIKLLTRPASNETQPQQAGLF